MRRLHLIAALWFLGAACEVCDMHEVELQEEQDIKEQVWSEDEDESVVELDEDESIVELDEDKENDDVGSHNWNFSDDGQKIDDRFKDCVDSHFCTRYMSFATFQNDLPEAQKGIYVVDNIAAGLEGQVEITVRNTRKGEPNILNVVLDLFDDFLRLRIDDEVSGVPSRYRPPPGDAVQRDLEKHRRRVSAGEIGDRTFSLATGTVRLRQSPFQLSVNVGDREILCINQGSLLNWEFHRQQEDANNGTAEVFDATYFAKKRSDLWEESWKQWTDSMPRGPQAVGVDVLLRDVDGIFGLPQRAAAFDLSLALSEGLHVPRGDQRAAGIFRLFNLDLFGYIPHSPRGLYGSIPFMMTRHRQSTLAASVVSGILWNNPSDTYVKVPQRQSPAPLDAGQSWFLSETGIIDLLLFVGGSPDVVLNRLMFTVGFPAMPPLYALGKHQCRWNYSDERDVVDVSKGHNVHEIPMDVLWLDIEYTPEKHYFSWRTDAFPDPRRLLASLWRDGRRLVAIIDPHVHDDQQWDVRRSFQSFPPAESELVLASQEGDAFVGKCWPGTSVYPDWTNPRVRHQWAHRFEQWTLPNDDLTANLQVWNDMNEPSVFESPEWTLPKGAFHPAIGHEHRAVHNLYGQYFMRSSYEGLKMRHPHKRPFVLSRAFYVNTPTFGAVWTGDNLSSWKHLEITTSMLLSHAMAGLSFVGADVGGFFGDPSEDLMVRWTQTGIWHPFYREHSHIESRRREPWLFSNEALERIRSAIRLRYRFLPFWYTLAADWSRFGLPMIRPTWMLDEQMNTLQAQRNAFLVGRNILVVPIADGSDTRTGNKVQPGPSEKLMQRVVAVEFPEALWYRLHFGSPMPDLATLRGRAKHDVDVTDEEIPVFVRGGSILFTKWRLRRSSKAMQADPFTMEVYLDDQSAASGGVFVDDGDSAMDQGTLAAVFGVAQARPDQHGIVVEFKRLSRYDRSLTDPESTMSVAHPWLVNSIFDADSSEAETHLRQARVSTRVERLVVHGLPGALSHMRVEFIPSEGGSPTLLKWETNHTEGTRSTIVVKLPTALQGEEATLSRNFKVHLNALCDHSDEL